MHLHMYTFTHTVITRVYTLQQPIFILFNKGCPALQVDFDVERELERANALRAFLSMDEYNPEALVASPELLT
jgi:hypothetical protein